jgi:hypothetical protein
MSDPASPQPHPAPGSAEPEPAPAVVEPAAGADEPAADPSGSDGGAKVPTWLVVLIVAVVVVVVVAIVGLLVFGGDEDSVAEVEGALPEQVTAEQADSPVVELAPGTQWSLDDGTMLVDQFEIVGRGTVLTICSYDGPEAEIFCSTELGDPTSFNGDVTNDTTTGTPLEPAVSVGESAEQVGTSFSGCPGSIRLRGPDDPMGQGPAMCVQTDQERVFALYLTRVAPEGALSFIAVEVTP